MDAESRDTVATGGAAAEGVVGSRMSRLFDLRYVIAGLLGLYGIVLLVRGLVDGDDEIAKAAGLAINLWTGLGMLVVAVLFGVWALLRPLGIEVGADADDLTTTPESGR